ncbi:hypothetical protein Peur_041551 [Populus x canadensis]
MLHEMQNSINCNWSDKFHNHYKKEYILESLPNLRPWFIIITRMVQNKVIVYQGRHATISFIYSTLPFPLRSFTLLLHFISGIHPRCLKS